MAEIRRSQAICPASRGSSTAPRSLSASAVCIRASTSAAARHSGKSAKIICLAPDVCLTPVGNSVVPIPYMIVSQLDWSDRTVSNTELTGQQAFTIQCRTNKVTGDEPGSNGGVKSGVNKGHCRPISKKTSVFVNGAELIQNDNMYDMNCSGPDGPGNTVGKLVFFE